MDPSYHAAISLLVDAVKHVAVAESDEPRVLHCFDLAGQVPPVPTQSALNETGSRGVWLGNGEVRATGC